MRSSYLLQGSDLGGLLEPSGIAAVFVLLLGTAVLVVSVELLIRGIVRTAIQFQLSAFMLAILFSGIDFDNFSFGLFTAARELENVAFGLAIGNPISVLGITLAVGALLFPFEVDVPREYLLIFAASPFAILPLLLLGSSSIRAGAVLLALFVLVFGYIVRREHRADRVFMQSDEVLEVLAEHDVNEEVLTAVEDHDERDTDVTELLSNRGVDPEVMVMVEDFDEAEEEGTLEEFLEELVEKAPPSVQQLAGRPWFWPGVLFVAVVGIVAGGETAAAGAEGILETWNLSGTFLGVTFITMVGAPPRPQSSPPSRTRRTPVATSRREDRRNHGRTSPSRWSVWLGRTASGQSAPFR